MAGYGYLLQSCPQRYYRKVNVRGLAELKGLPNKCEKCGSTENLMIDHKLPKAINPKARGLLANYRLLCERCNVLRSGATSEVAKYKKLLSKHPNHKHREVWQAKMAEAIQRQEMI